MTREKILAVEVGEELDKAVHEVIMGLCAHEWGIAKIDERRYFVAGKICKKCAASFLFAYSKYSADILAAWQVVEKMKEDGILFTRFTSELMFLLTTPETEPLLICVDLLVKLNPETICKAALLTKLEVGDVS